MTLIPHTISIMNQSPQDPAMFGTYSVFEIVNGSQISGPDCMCLSWLSKPIFIKIQEVPTYFFKALLVLIPAGVYALVAGKVGVSCPAIQGKID